MRALIILDALGRIVILSTDDAWLADQYGEFKDETLDVDASELKDGTFYLWTGKTTLTYQSPLDGGGPDGSVFERTEPLKEISTGSDTLTRLDELLMMCPPADEEIDTKPRDTTWD